MSSGSAPESWEEGKLSEENFWSRWVESGGSEWPQDFKARMDPNRELQTTLADQLRVSKWRKPVILDVGAGPMSVVGKRWRGKPVKLVAVDPLADTYNQLLDKNGVKPLVRTAVGYAERLSELFDKGSFDLVYMENALDHSYDPLEGIRQMVTVAKPQGVVVLDHHRNEGEFENYVGFHQWNIDERDGGMYLWNKSDNIDVGKNLEGFAQVSAVRHEDRVRSVIRRPVG